MRSENIEVFFCYAREDELLRQGLEKQLGLLKRQGLITTWYDREIQAGQEWQQEINAHLNTARIILLLVSPDFMVSDYFYGIEMMQAMERHKRKEAHVIPIILRPVYWQGAPFGRLQVLPTDAKPVISPRWHSLDEAFFDVAEGIRRTIELLTKEKHLTNTTLDIVPVSPPQTAYISPRETILWTSRYPKEIRDAAWSPDGTRVASFSDDQTVQIWDAKTGRLTFVYKGHSHQVQSIAWSPDGTRIASASDDQTVQIWDASNGVCDFIYKGHASGVRAIAWSPNGRYIASSGHDNIVLVWDAATRNKVFVRKSYAHIAREYAESGDGYILESQETVHSIAWSPDSIHIATTSSGSTTKGTALRITQIQLVSSTLMVWGLATEGTMATYNWRQFAAFYSFVTWSPDGKYIASGESSRGVQVWDAATGNEAFKCQENFTQTPNSVAWSPDGKYIAASLGTVIRVWDASTGIAVNTYQFAPPQNTSLIIASGLKLAWSPDSRRITMASNCVPDEAQNWKNSLMQYLV